MRDDTRAGIAGIAAFALSFLFGVAGSLMIAPAVAIMALVAFPVEPSFWRPGRVPISGSADERLIQEEVTQLLEASGLAQIHGERAKGSRDHNPR